MNSESSAAHAPGGADPGPIFVVGSMRSGSTMLRLILDSHPHIAIGPETGFMSGLRGVKEVPDWKFGKGWYERLNWSEDEFDERLREFYAGMFRRYALDQGKQRWGEKTPFHTAHIEAMARVFPDSVFVGIVRHPGAVAASLRKNFHYTFADALSYWTAANLDLVNAGSKLGRRFTLCRYEDLVREPEQVLREVMTAIEEPWHSNLLQHHRVQRDKGAPRAAEGNTVTRDPVDASRAVRWTDGATDEDYIDLRRAAGLAGFFGYEPLVGVTTCQWGSSETNSTWTLSGADLALRRRAWGGRVNFSARPPDLLVGVSREELANRLVIAESALGRVRSRRAIRLADALRKLQHGRSPDAIREAWALIRSRPGEAG